MDFFTAMEVSASGLATQRTRMNVASSNLANVNTTAPEGEEGYRRLDVVVRSQRLAGSIAGHRAGSFDNTVRTAGVAEIVQDQQPMQMDYDPGHPDANAEGYVAYPNVNAIEEMVDMITASRAYEAGITALGTAVNMAERALGIGR
ncbi:MAG: flagellar basal body rod protein FlgC [Myxococcales bacterium]|nr:flagellar basal body rod protein FlgC [Myxococcales bacterium]